MHNHPSGTLEHSNQDFLITKQIVKAGSILCVKVLDHLIISKKGHKSKKEKGDTSTLVEKDLSFFDQ
ncbi:MAG: JAB domain-containing protein [Thermoplasmata archaeon]